MAAPLRAADAATYAVRPLPTGSAVLRDTVLRLGAGADGLATLAAHGAGCALAVQGLAHDEIRVLERQMRQLGGEVLTNRDGDRAVVIGPLRSFGELSTRLVEWGRRTEALGAAIQEAMTGSASPPPPLLAGRHRLTFGSRTLVMGVVNCTPDSFSGNGVGSDAAAAVALGEAMAEAGADIVDVGGESTRPGSVAVPLEEEAARVLPVVTALAEHLDVPVSIDTRKAEVARRATAAGAAIINDVWGLHGDPAMARVVAEAGAALVAMHNAKEVAYGDVVEDVAQVLRHSLALAEDAGIDLQRVIVDPGIGFAKTPAHNLELIRRLSELRGINRPILVGASRKSTIGALLGGAPPAERLEGSLALAVLAAANGANILRVHDVAETLRALRVADAVIRGTPEHVAALGAPGRTG